MTLATLDATQWRYLREAVEDAKHPFRNVTLASVGEDGTPQARYLILRSANADTRTLELHTDTRSAKWSELAANPKVAILAYDAEARVQLRLTGTAFRHAPDDPENATAWNALSTWARKTYCGGPPGVVTDWAQPEDVTRIAPTEAEVALGRDRFGVLIIQIDALDWFQHPRGDIRRARFRYASDGAIASANWIEP